MKVDTILFKPRHRQPNHSCIIRAYSFWWVSCGRNASGGRRKCASWSQPYAPMISGGTVHISQRSNKKLFPVSCWLAEMSVRKDWEQFINIPCHIFPFTRANFGLDNFSLSPSFPCQGKIDYFSPSTRTSVPCRVDAALLWKRNISIRLHVIGNMICIVVGLKIMKAMTKRNSGKLKLNHWPLSHPSLS